ncbi:TetR family transcriptional regulator [Micromonospora sonneratiae]|uniref:TetR family transcriptional regulator n=1 Tax=Micromonospora sonneratiae TaxID=1184706 RepID=A0ABW3YB83_9ACTN
MQVKSQPPNRRTVTNEARRAQIIAYAIETIAELGYARASFAQIARRAGLSSTRLISYHFAGKDELMVEVMRTVLAEFAAFVQSHAVADTVAGELRALIEANVDFMRDHRAHLMALNEIAANARGTGEVAAQTAAITESDLAGLAELLRRGQRAGEFREFDTRVLAVAVLALRDAVVAQLAKEPELDLAPYRRELVTLIELATRKETS